MNKLALYKPSRSLFYMDVVLATLGFALLLGTATLTVLVWRL